MLKTCATLSNSCFLLIYQFFCLDVDSCLTHSVMSWILGILYEPRFCPPTPFFCLPGLFLKPLFSSKSFYQKQKKNVQLNQKTRTRNNQAQFDTQKKCHSVATHISSSLHISMKRTWNIVQIIRNKLQRDQHLDLTSTPSIPNYSYV